MKQPQSCEYCKELIHCRNLYVAMKILEEELRFAQRDDLWHEFRQLEKDLRNWGFSYPDGSSTCDLTHGPDNARALVSRADAILRELRRTVSISPA